MVERERSGAGVNATTVSLTEKGKERARELAGNITKLVVRRKARG